jgi:hypothetical protein
MRKKVYRGTMEFEQEKYLEEEIEADYWLSKHPYKQKQ